MATYHRKQSTSQTLRTAIYQVYSKEIWGQAARGSDYPSVKAYVGPLGRNEDGIEFEVDVPPHPGSTPTVAKWYLGYEPNVSGVKNQLQYCKMSVSITELRSGDLSCNFKT
ncbi:MAG: hypothetical protein ABW202_07035 [Duganella sp.]